MQCDIERCGNNNENCGLCERPVNAYSRLAEYEDTGLTPKENKSLLHDGGIAIAMRNQDLKAENTTLRAQLKQAQARAQEAESEVTRIIKGMKCKCHEDPVELYAQLLAANAEMRAAFSSIHDAIAFSSRDWAEHHRDAWIYGIICGWDDASYRELKAKHRWTDDTVSRNKRLHQYLSSSGSALLAENKLLEKALDLACESTENSMFGGYGITASKLKEKYLQEAGEPDEEQTYGL
jgi:hypothetical protein